MSAPSAPRPGSARTEQQHLELLHVPKDATPITVMWLADPIGIIVHRRGSSARDDHAQQIPCPGPRECPAAQHALRSAWKGYAPVCMWRDRPHTDWVPYVLEVTEMLAELIGDQPMRGQVWSLYRIGSGPRAKQVNGHVEDVVDVTEIPVAFDVRTVVTRVMRTTNIQWGVPQHLPPREVVQPWIGYIPPTALPLPPTAEELAEEQERKRKDVEESRRLLKAQLKGGAK